MRRPEGREKSSVLFLGKGIIILSLVLTSSLSFLLGYLVGKNTEPDDLSRMQQLPVPVQQPVTPAELNPYPEEDQKEGPMHQPLQTSEDESVPQQNQSEKLDKPVRDPAVPQKNTTDISANNRKKEQQKAEGSSQQKKTGEVTKETSKTVKYTVQIGAFKNEADALAIKTKFEKKGYKTQVLVTKDRNGEKIYKVMVGAFSMRKDAEILALKLKKSEGLKTFVTFHKNTEEIR